MLRLLRFAGDLSESRSDGEKLLAVEKAEAHGARGAANINEGDGALQLMVAGFVEEVGETDDSHGVTDEVDGEARVGAAEHPNDRIQFLSSALQVGAGHREVSAIQSGGGNE